MSNIRRDKDIRLLAFRYRYLKELMNSAKVEFGKAKRNTGEHRRLDRKVEEVSNRIFEFQEVLDLLGIRKEVEELMEK